MDVRINSTDINRDASLTQPQSTKPARNPVTPSGKGFRAKFYSAKNNRLVRCESLLEFDCLHLFEFARGVDRYIEQPKQIRYRVGASSRTYTPDFSVDWADGRRWFVEVKPADVLREPENQDKFACLTEVFKSMGERLLVLTDTEIRKPLRLAQIKRLLQARNGKWLDDDARTSMPSSRLENLTIAEALRTGASEKAVARSLATRELVCSLDEAIDGSTLLLPFAEGHDDALFL